MADLIVMIHGMWSGGWCWDQYKEFFEHKGYRCISPTLRFHDVPPNAPPNPQLGTVSLLDYAADIEKQIRKLDDIPILMGHSMGGLLAQIISSRGLAKAAIFLTPASPAGIIALNPSVIKSFWSVLTKWGFWKKPMRQTSDEAVYAMLHLMPPKEQKKILNRMVYESGRAASEIGFWLFDPKKASKVDASKVACPVLVIAGTEDRTTPVAVVRKVARKYRHVCTYKEFPRHAHWIFGEQNWKEIAQYVADWLAQKLNNG
jgi:pimeloyl-ACP methyl ester carboxylesterase